MLACSKQSALLSLNSISRVIQWMNQAHAIRRTLRGIRRTLRGSRNVCLRETALALTVVGVEGSMLRGQNHKEKKIKIDIFRKFGINLGINVGASSELRSMGCLPPPHSDSGFPLSDRGWSATAAQRRRTSPSRAPPQTPSSLAGACRSHGGGSRPARPSQPRCWQFAIGWKVKV